MYLILTCNSETLVIGKALDPHSFQDITKTSDRHGSELGTSVKLTGLTSPWNTFAIWDLPKLAKVASGMHDVLSLISFFFADGVSGSIRYECPTRSICH
jgi:hypothetical protein